MGMTRTAPVSADELAFHKRPFTLISGAVGPCRATEADTADPHQSGSARGAGADDGK
jgi:hypothetical protein